jgi:hypothetical protein
MKNDTVHHWFCCVDDIPCWYTLVLMTLPAQAIKIEAKQKLYNLVTVNVLFGYERVGN